MEEDVNNGDTAQPVLPPVPETEVPDIGVPVVEPIPSPQPGVDVTQEQPITPVESTPETVYAPQPQFPQNVEVAPPAVETTTTWSQSTSVDPTASVVAVNNNKFFTFIKNHKKLLFIIGGSILGVVLLSVIGFFGYKLYVNASDGRILQKTAQNVIDGKNMTTEVNVGAMGFSVSGILDVDKDQNMHFRLKNDLIPLDISYIKETDRAYLGSESYDYSDEGTSDAGLQKTKKYTAYTNVRKAIDNFTSKNLNPSVFDPNKNYFTVDNQKYMKRQADEKQDGKSLYKFTFTPDKEFIEKAIEEAKQTTVATPFTVSNADIKIDFLINKADYKLYKITGSIKLGLDSESKEDTYVAFDLSKIELTWDQKFTYDFKDVITAPNGGSVESTEDLNDLLDPAVSEAKAEDSRSKAEVREIQSALEQYFLDNDSYPTNLTVLKNTSSSDFGDYESSYLYSDVDVKNYTYKYTGTPPSNYTLSFKLKNQKDSGTNIFGNAPNKIYKVTNK